MDIRTIDGFTVVGLGVDTNVENAPRDCPPLWATFIERYKEIPNPAPDAGEGGVMYGPCVTTGECDFRTLAAIEVIGEGAVPEGMERLEIPGGKYAVYEHKGKMDTLQQTYAFIMEDLKRRGLKEDKFWFEKYGDRYKHEEDDSVFEIWCQL